MDESQRIRLQKLVRGIEDLLDRGVAPEKIKAELLRRGMAPVTADSLIGRVVQARKRGAEPQPRPVPTAPPAPANPQTQRFTFKVAPARTTAFSRTRDVARGFVAHWTAHTPASRVLAVASIALVLIGSNRLLDRFRAAGAHEREQVVARLQTEIEAARVDINRFEAELLTRTVEASDLEALRKRIARGPRAYPTAAAYRTDVARYKKAIKTWNATVAQYRQLGQVYTATVALHNSKLDSLTTASRGFANEPPATAAGATPAPRRVRFSTLVPAM